MGLLNKVKEYFELVKFEHSIFALPFALGGMLLAKASGWPQIATFVWVILAMVSGRTAAMALNRIIDKDIDKKNPRTRNRAIPAGRIKVSHALILTIVSLFIMIFAVMQLPLICQLLLPAAIFIIIIYSYAKRFTVYSHFVLGAVLGSAATGGWIAVTGELNLPSILWGLAVISWVSGFDIIYSTLDFNFDRQQGLYSLPATAGLEKALLISRICHVSCIVLLIILALLLAYGWIFWIAILFVAAMLIYEQSLVTSEDLSRVNTAFFNINGFVSIGILVFIILEKLI